MFIQGFNLALAETSRRFPMDLKKVKAKCLSGGTRAGVI